jgi:hypothetical protein
MPWRPIDLYAAGAGQPLDVLRAVADNAEAIRAGRPVRLHLAWPARRRPILASADARARVLCHLPALPGDVQVSARVRGLCADGGISLGLLTWQPGDPPPLWRAQDGLTLAPTGTDGVIPAVSLQGRGGAVALYLVHQSEEGFAGADVYKRTGGNVVDSTYRSVLALGSSASLDDGKRYGAQIQIDSAGDVPGSSFGPARTVLRYPSSNPHVITVAPPVWPDADAALEGLNVDLLLYELGLFTLHSVVVEIAAPGERSTRALATGRNPRARSYGAIAGSLTESLKRAPVRGVIACADPTAADTADRPLAPWGAVVPLEDYTILAGTWATGTTYRVTISDGTNTANIDVVTPANLNALYGSLEAGINTSSVARRLVTADYITSVGVYVYPRTTATITITTSILSGTGTLTADRRRDVCAGVIPVTGVTSETIRDLRGATAETLTRGKLTMALSCLATGASGAPDETLTVGLYLRLATWSGSAWETDVVEGDVVEVDVRCFRDRNRRDSFEILNSLGMTQPQATTPPSSARVWSTLDGALPIDALGALTLATVGVEDTDPAAVRRCELWVRGAWISKEGARASLSSPRFLHVWGATLYTDQEVL